MKTYLMTFPTECQAREWMRARNRAYADAGNQHDLVVMVDGPDENFAVVDIDTASEKRLPYVWEQ